jgi:hypothetical protein
MSPRLWAFEGVPVGQASRLPSNDLQSQAGRLRHTFQNIQKNLAWYKKASRR